MHYSYMQQYERILQYRLEFKKKVKKEYIHSGCIYINLKMVQNYNKLFRDINI